MTSFDQNQPPGGDPYLAPPPPVAYPTKDGHGGHHHPIQTNSKSDNGFWKACCVALCSCCDQGWQFGLSCHICINPNTIV